MSAGKRHNLQGQVVRLETIKLHLENEIERKKETINVMIDNEEKYCLEIERLNNIINEIEKMMKNDLECACSMNENGLFNGAIDILEVYLDKLQELKGSE